MGRPSRPGEIGGSRDHDHFYHRVTAANGRGFLSPGSAVQPCGRGGRVRHDEFDAELLGQGSMRLAVFTLSPIAVRLTVRP